MPFDPARARAGRGYRGRRFRLLLASAGVLTVGALAFEGWLWSGRGRDGGSPARDVTPAAGRGQIPDYALPRPEATVVTVPVVKEVPKEVEVPRDRPVQGPAPATSPRPAAEPKRPQALSWRIVVEEPKLDWYLDGRRPRLATGCALRPGATIVEAALLTEVRSEVAGEAIAQVTSDVYDADGVGRLLVPAGTRVVGVYKRGGGLEFQRQRLDFAWTEMTLPDGTQVALADAAGMDAAGAMGVGGQVRMRWAELVATAALVTVFDVAERTAVGPGSSYGSQAAAAAGRSAGQLGEEVTRQVLHWEPEILIRAGTQVRLTPTRTVRVC